MRSVFGHLPEHVTGLWPRFLGATGRGAECARYEAQYCDYEVHV